MDETVLLRPLPLLLRPRLGSRSQRKAISGGTHKLISKTSAPSLHQTSHSISAIVSSKQLKALCSFTMLPPKHRSTTSQQSTPRFQGKGDQVDQWSLWGINAMMLTSGKLSRLEQVIKELCRQTVSTFPTATCPTLQSMEIDQLNPPAITAHNKSTHQFPKRLALTKKVDAWRSPSYSTHQCLHRALSNHLPPALQHAKRSLQASRSCSPACPSFVATLLRKLTSGILAHHCSHPSIMQL
jgi:hypothetical protein